MGVDRLGERRILRGLIPASLLSQSGDLRREFASTDLWLEVAHVIGAKDRARPSPSQSSRVVQPQMTWR